MSGLRSNQQPDVVERLNGIFARIGVWSYDHRALVLGASALLLAGCVWLAGSVRFDSSMEAFFDTEDDTYAAYERYRADFGSDEIAYILYEAPGVPDGVFDLGVMRRIAALTRAFEEEVPFVDEVTSLSNVEYVEGVADGIEVYDLLADFPRSQAELDVARAKLMGKSLYLDNLVSRDGRYAAIILEMEVATVDSIEALRLDPEGGDGLDNLYPQVSYRVIQEILARPEFEGIVFHHGGDVALNAYYNESTAGDSALLGVGTLLVVGVLLAVFLRRPIGVAGPLLVVCASILVSIAAIVALGWDLDFFFIMLPVLLIAVGVADAVHVIAEFHANHAELGDRREAARRTLQLVGTPCLLTSLTTAAGFLSMSVAPIVAIQHLAVYSAIGVSAAFFFSVTLLFAVLTFGRRHPKRAPSEQALLRARGGRVLQAVLAAVVSLVLRRRGAILVAFALLFVFSAAGISRLQVDSNFITEIDEDAPVRRATDLVDQTMGGTLSLVYLFDSGTPEGVKSPQLLQSMAALQAAADGEEQVVRRSSSVGDLLKDVNRSFHAEDQAYYALPETRELIGQYLLVYEMSGGDELGSYVSGDFSTAGLELRLRTTGSGVLEKLDEDLDRWLRQNPVKGADVSATGPAALWLRLQTYITQSQIRGFGLAIVVIALLLCAVFQSFKTGLLAMIPNLSPIVLTLGVMGWIDLPLDYVRLLIASVAIGISVDDTIHHVTRFRLEFRRCGNYAEALRSSMADVGRALLVTSLVLMAGFLVMLGSELDSMQTFGALLAGTVAVALVADFLLMPALVLSFEPWGPERGSVPVPAEGSTSLAR